MLRPRFPIEKRTLAIPYMRRIKNFMAQQLVIFRLKFPLREYDTYLCAFRCDEITDLRDSLSLKSRKRYRWIEKLNNCSEKLHSSALSHMRKIQNTDCERYRTDCETLSNCKNLILALSIIHLTLRLNFIESYVWKSAFLITWTYMNNLSDDNCSGIKLFQK